MFVDTLLDLTKELSDLKDIVPAETFSLLTNFNRGYMTGYHWPDKWGTQCPGGPWIVGPCSFYGHRPQPVDGCKYCDKAKASAMENAIWRKGWAIGHDKKIREGRKNPLPSREATQECNEGKRESNLW